MQGIRTMSWSGCCLGAVSLLFGSGCATSPGAGDTPPAFSAVLDSGKTATLESLLGEKGLVLYFYPRDETLGCVTQACAFQDQLVDFQRKGFRVVGVSVDTGASHQTFKSKHDLTFDLIADTENRLARLFDVPTEPDPFGTLGFRRTTFVIARDGNSAKILMRFEDHDPKEQVRLASEAVSLPF